MKIFLIGFMGVGKTTFGKKLSRKCGFNFLDLDKYIEEKEGYPIPEMFNKFGEEHFRKVEAENLRLLEKISYTVISTGGGAPCYNDNMGWMNSHGTTVYLRMSDKALFDRLKKSKKQKRPLLKGKSKSDLQEFISQKLHEREIYYNQAHYTVDAANVKVSMVKDLLNI